MLPRIKRTPTKNPAIIIFGGDVGGGKTTHSSLLVKNLNRIGLKAKYLHIKNFHFLSRLLLLFTIRVHLGKKLLKYTRKFSPVKILIISDTNLFRRIFKLLSFLNLIDIIAITILRQYVAKILYKIVIFEDHLIGYTNDLIYFMNVFKKLSGKPMFPGFELWLVGLRFLTKAAQDSYILFLYAPYSELIKRYKLRGTPPAAPVYIAAGRVATKIIKKIGLNVEMIDTSVGNVVNIHKRILHNVLNYVGIYSGESLL